MTTQEAIDALHARGFYAVADEDASLRPNIRGGTSRRQEGGIGVVENGFIVWQRADSKWEVRHPGPHQGGVVHVVDTLDEAFARVCEFLDALARICCHCRQPCVSDWHETFDREPIHSDCAFKRAADVILDMSKGPSV